MAAVSLFRYTNMAAVTSDENALLEVAFQFFLVQCHRHHIVLAELISLFKQAHNIYYSIQFLKLKLSFFN